MQMSCMWFSLIWKCSARVLCLDTVFFSSSTREHVFCRQCPGFQGLHEGFVMSTVVCLYISKAWQGMLIIMYHMSYIDNYVIISTSWNRCCIRWIICSKPFIKHNELFWHWNEWNTSVIDIRFKLIFKIFF